MSRLNFSDGMEFDTTGPYRAEFRDDGWYVVGNGMLIPVASRQEANKLIKEMLKEQEDGRYDKQT